MMDVVIDDDRLIRRSREMRQIQNTVRTFGARVYFWQPNFFVRSVGVKTAANQSRIIVSMRPPLLKEHLF
jgi:hypothetical protein